ncbi:sodium/hydrogen exchanger 8 [Selaginella moellendorffii]|uniref:sodium/hydrogen exchanger 8 n=1 Tax=Selaginella moellendorffii TaxID=88036 RepID=UPI000D1CF577|nr:sodium/hydrogen exchanger 8 [Selaginella moellendorffii]|eukprot:XP_024527441.1 sodium/hydrogen exchanger 8 [Selaginella moellendorffii]
MAAITTGSRLNVAALDAENPPSAIEKWGPETAILFVVVSLAIGTVSRQILHKTKVPYTVALLVIGMGLGALEYGTQRGLGSLGHSIRLWSNIHPNLILYVFLPALLFESSFSMEVHQIKRCLLQMVLLAGPGVVISTFCLGLFSHFILPYGWSWSVSLLLGGLLSATDPVAVVSLLRDVKASKKLSTIIEGEALMNDGTAMVVFELFHQMVLGKHFSAGDICKFLSQVALGSVALGMTFGMLSIFWLGIMFNDTVIEITLTFTASYCAFFIAQHVAGVSGVLAVMTVGMLFAAFGRAAFKGENQQSMHCFWTIIAYFANTVIFILSGVVIAESFLRSQSEIEGRDWAYLLCLYFFLQLSRALVVIALYPGLSYYGYGLSFKEALILVWSGLRGAVALALSLSVKESENDQSVAGRIQAKFVFFTGGVVFLTLIVNGTSTQFLLKFLHMEKTSETKRLVLEHVNYEVNSKAAEAFEELGEDEELGPADWPTVRKYISCLNRLPEDEARIHPQDAPTSEGDTRKTQLQDLRLRFLNGVQAAYWVMLEEGRITQTAALLLMQSVDEALDRVAKQDVLSDWSGVHPHVHCPSYLKHLQTGNFFLPQKLLTYLVVERLELSCYISAAFLRAHLLVRRHLRAFIGETEVGEIVIKESEEETVEAKQFLEGIRLTFSQVLLVVKTKQVVHAILLRISDYIQSLEKSGLLEDSETMHLHDAVQADLKRLLRNPPSVSMPKGADLLRTQPFITSLPSQIQALIFNSSKEFLKLRGSVLYKEGSRADGLWLIANGIVKWNTSSNSRHLLHPTFSHGSTLGLYEVIMGKSFLCDLIADSVVQCFYLEASKVLSILQANTELEQFFWQESTLPVLKIILPDFFEAMPMHELRVIVQNSSMISFIRGEIIEVPVCEIGLLIEGFIKQDGENEIIGAPAGIVCPSHETERKVSGNGVFYGNIFHVETRSRLVLIRHNFHTRVSSQSLLSRRSSAIGHDSSFSLRYRGRHGSDQSRNSEQQILARMRQGSATTTKANEANVLEEIKVESAWKRGSTGQIWPQQPQAVPPLFPGGVPRRSLERPRELQPQGSLPLISAPPVPPLPALRTRRKLRKKQLSSDSSDASSGDEEEEHIVQIESPSSLFHNAFK